MTGRAHCVKSGLMADVTLFTPGRIDGFETRNRIVMAPMTRSRALPNGVPSELAVDYYRQRASGPDHH